MSYPQATGLVWMTCQGAYDSHGGMTQYNAWVPFIEAITAPPECHGLPRLTEGGRRMNRLASTWREHGPVVECRLSGKGEGQGVSCYSHGWSGVYHDLGEHDRCPSYPIATWLTRRAALRAEGETP